MSPVSQLSVLAFASTVLASPFAGHGHQHAHRHLHTGPAPYPLPAANSTGVWASTGVPSGSSTAAPVEYTTRFETQYSTVNVNYNSAAGTGSVSVAAVESSAGQCGNDVTVTTTEKVYVTVTGGESPSSSAAVSAAGGSSSKAASTVHVTHTYTAPGSYGASSSEAAPVSSSSAANSAPAYSAPSSSEAAPVSSSSSAAAYSAQSSSEAAPVSTSSAAAYSAPASSSSQAAPAYTSSSSSAAAILPTSILGSLADKGSYNSAAATTSSSAAATSSSSSTGSTGTGKRGLGYNEASLLSCFSGSSEISWAYNWGSSSNGLSGFTFIPTLWGPTDTFTSSWTANADSAISSGSTHLFSFNEPDESSQANLSPSDAATQHIKYMNPYAGKAKICAPSVTNGPASSNMGLQWLSEFITACDGKCQIDCYNIHWYDSATNIDYFKEHVNNATSMADGKPVWVTEFGATGSDDQINTFLETVMPWMDSNDNIAGYAYYMASSGLLISGTEPSTYGSTYKTYTS